MSKEKRREEPIAINIQCKNDLIQIVKDILVVISTNMIYLVYISIIIKTLFPIT